MIPVASAGAIGILKAGLDLAGMGALRPIVDEIREADSARRRSSSSAAAGDAATLLVEAKNRFAAAVAELVGEADESTAPGRVVIFIDDLDRLEPRKAVELMESLKLFLDVPHCVFVLAIDFAVVEQGVSAKYGEAMDRAKARSFFDKIIQVPFQMPTGAYQIDQLLGELSTQTGLSLGTDADRAAYLTLIAHSIGSNPRSIKRLINTFVLLRGIAEIASASGGDKISDAQLFAILCLQTAYPDAYLEIVSSEPYSDSELYQRYFGDGDAELDSEPLTADALHRYGIEPGATRFAPLAVAVVDQFRAESGVDEQRLARALKQAMTTSSGADATSAPSPRGKKVYEPEARRARLAEKVAWGGTREPLRIPELIAQRLEQHERVAVGTPPGDVQGWVIEAAGRRRGMLSINKSSCHLSLEAGHFVNTDPTTFVERLIDEIPEVRGRVRESDSSASFQVRGIQPDETALADRLAAFWLKLITEELDAR